MDKVIVYTAGSSRGNPGPAAVGVFVTKSNGEVVSELAKGIGNASDNFAEYYGVMLAFQTLKQIYEEQTKTLQFEIRLASELVKKQLNNESQINEPGLVPMFIEIHNLQVADFPNVIFVNIPKKNKGANRLVGEVLDGR